MTKNHVRAAALLVWEIVFFIYWTSIDPGIVKTIMIMVSLLFIAVSIREVFYKPYGIETGYDRVVRWIKSKRNK